MAAGRARHAPAPADQHEQEEVGGREALAEKPGLVAELLGDHVEHAVEALAGRRRFTVAAAASSVTCSCG